MTSLKERTASALIWSLIDNFSKRGTSFIIGIILARLLTPREFGLIGMTSVFINVSQSFIDSGFERALIRKQDCTQTDYSTVFYFNLIMGIFIYSLLYLFADSISIFLNEPQLKLVIQILGICLIINSLTIIQRVILTKRIDFKLQTKISLLATSISGLVGIFMAYKGYGVWSLVLMTLISYAITSILLWIWNRWIPQLKFSHQSFKELFSFGSRLLVSGLIDRIYHNSYLIIIGKFFSATELGFFTRADQFNKIASENITGVIQRVSYPVLSSIQDDLPRLRKVYQELIGSTMLITFLSMFMLAAIAENLIIALIGDKWLPSVTYLHLLCFVGMFFPLHAINLNMLNVQGRSDLFLKLEIIKKVMAIPVIIIGIWAGIKIMIVGMIINSIIAFFINSYYSGRSIKYSNIQQLRDILPSFLLALFIGFIIFLLNILMQQLSFGVITILCCQLVIGILLTIFLLEMFTFKSYEYIKQTIKITITKRYLL